MGERGWGVGGGRCGEGKGKMTDIGGNCTIFRKRKSASRLKLPKTVDQTTIK